MATTAAAIRAAMLSLLEDITPRVHSGDRFRAHRELGDFRDWCEAHPTACQRRVSIRNAGNTTAAAVSNTLAEEVSDAFEVVIAYPTNWRHGDAGLLDIDDVIASDLVQVDKTIGPTGYGNFGTVVPSCTVIREGDYERESLAGVTVGVIRYRVHFYRALVASVDQPVTVTGLGGVHLVQGDIITGEENLRAIVMGNGIVRWKYIKPLVGSEPAGGHLFVVNSAGADVKAMADQYGDWAFFAAPNVFTADRAIIVEATSEAVEIALVWDVLQLNQAYLNNLGIVYRDWLNGLIYPDTSNAFRYIPSTKLTKVMRLERGKDGYFVGWHTSPHVGPALSRMTGVGCADNNEPAWGERELGTGGGDAVLFSSAGFTAYFPAWSTRAIWATAETQNGSAYTERHWWTGIDDPTYGAMATAAFAQTQNAGFPGQQSVGPWWVGGMPGSDQLLGDVCRYMVFQKPIESGGWQFMPGANRAASVAHFCNNWPAPSGIAYRFQVFIGAFGHVADATAVAVTGYTGNVEYGNEPTKGARERIASQASALVWPI